MTDPQPKWWSDDSVTIAMYHNSPPALPTSEQGGEPNQPWCHLGWHSETALACLGGAFDEAPMWEVYERHLANATPHALPHDSDPGMDVWWIMGKPEQLRALADHWADIAVADAETVGGDDTYYDYYPDYLNGLWQLCVAINYPDPINRAKGAAFNGPYAGDPEAVDLMPPMFTGR